MLTNRAPLNLFFIEQGNFAKYYLTVSAGNSGLHAGMYEPGKQELQNIREQIITNSAHGIALRNLVRPFPYINRQKIHLG